VHATTSMWTQKLTDSNSWSDRRSAQAAHPAGGQLQPHAVRAGRQFRQHERRREVLHHRGAQRQLRRCAGRSCRPVGAASTRARGLQVVRNAAGAESLRRRLLRLRNYAGCRAWRSKGHLCLLPLPCHVNHIALGCTLLVVACALHLWLLARRSGGDGAASGRGSVEVHVPRTHFRSVLSVHHDDAGPTLHLYWRGAGVLLGCLRALTATRSHRGQGLHAER